MNNILLIRQLVYLEEYVQKTQCCFLGSLMLLKILKIPKIHATHLILIQTLKIKFSNCIITTTKLKYS